jgi:hypothetical protein
MKKSDQNKNERTRKTYKYVKKKTIKRVLCIHTLFFIISLFIDTYKTYMFIFF